jgi:hypothetical protein
MSVETCYRLTLKYDACRGTIETQDHEIEPQPKDLKPRAMRVEAKTPGSVGRVFLRIEAFREGSADPADLCDRCVLETLAQAWRERKTGAGRYEFPDPA